MSGKTPLSTVVENADGRHAHSHHGHSRSSRTTSSSSRGNRVKFALLQKFFGLSFLVTYLYTKIAFVYTSSFGQNLKCGR